LKSTGGSSIPPVLLGVIIGFLEEVFGIANSLKNTKINLLKIFPNTHRILNP